MCPEIQESWRAYWGQTHPTLPISINPHDQDEQLTASATIGGEPITWTNRKNVAPYGPSAFCSTYQSGTVFDYPTMKEWLFRTYPQGTAAIFSPETVKLQKVDWSKAKFNGTSERFNEWMQTVLAIKKANAVPDKIPDSFGRQVTEAIATHFSAQAAEAWLNTPEGKRPRHIGTNDPTDKDQSNIIAWVRQRFRSVTHELIKHQELQTMKWEPKAMSLTAFCEKFNTTMSEAGYGPGRPLAEQFKIEWFTQTLPLPLATSVRSVIFANQSDRVQLNAQLAALGKDPLPDYEATLTQCRPWQSTIAPSTRSTT